MSARNDDREDRLNHLLAGYFDEVEAGAPVDRRQWLVRFPEFFDELSDFFGDTDAVEAIAAPLREVSRAVDEELALDWLTPSEHPEHLGRLGDYEVIGWLGRGGMGVVYKGADVSLNRSVAIKVLAPQWSADSGARKRFTREARATAAISHPHVITIYAVGEWHGRPYLVMEYVTGVSLQQRLNEVGPLELQEILRIGVQVASGLAAAHAQGLIHRDIKPSNIMLENELARVKLTDFGLARAVDDTHLTQNGTLAGTPSYMAPEQARGEPLDRRSDLFSLGSVLYAMCAGRAAFRGDSTVEVLRRVSDEQPTPIRNLNSEIPSWLIEIVERLHAKDPADRFHAAAEVGDVLERHLARLQDPSLPPVAHAWVRRRGLRARSVALLKRTGGRWLAAPLLVLAGALGTVAWTHWAVRGPAVVSPSSNQPAPVPSSFDSSRLKEEYRYDFRNEKYDYTWLRIEGSGILATLMKPERRGLRLAIPPKTQGRLLGIYTRFGVHGDFEITASFEVLAAEKPQAGKRVGPELYLRAVPDSENHMMSMARVVTANSDSPTILANIGQKIDGSPRYHGTSIDSSAREVKFRIVRAGSAVYYFVAEGAAGPFRQIYQTEFGTKDIDRVRIAALFDGSDHRLDLLWKDLTIRAEELPGWTGGGASTAVRFPIGIAAAGVSGFLCLVAGLWWRASAQRAQQQAAPEAKTLAAPTTEQPAAADSWDEDALLRLEERARAYAEMHPDVTTYLERPQFEFSLTGGNLHGPFVVWASVGKKTMRRLGNSWDEVREKLPRRIEGAYRDGKRNGTFRFRDRSGSVEVRRYRDGERVA
jgi:serine/threonine protein kinase